MLLYPCINPEQNKTANKYRTISNPIKCIIKPEPTVMSNTVIRFNTAHISEATLILLEQVFLSRLISRAGIPSAYPRATLLL